MFRNIEPYRRFGLKWMILLVFIGSLCGALFSIIVHKHDVSVAILSALFVLPLTVFSVECILWAVHRLRGGDSK